MEICARLLNQYPNLRLAVSLVAEADVLSGLLSFDFDAGVIGNPTDDPRFFSSFYKRYRINIIVHVDHPLARGARSASRTSRSSASFNAPAARSTAR